MERILFYGLFFAGLAAAGYSQEFRVSYYPGEAVAVPLVRTALVRAGLDPKFLEQPAARSLALVSAGEVQAEFFRTEAAIAPMAALIKVPVPLITTNYVAVTLDSGPAIRSLHDLEGQRVGFPLGYSILTQSFQGLAQALAVPNEVSTLKMLRAGRLDVAVMPDTLLAHFAKEAGLSAYRAASPPLLVEPSFLVVHQSQGSLVPRLQEVLQKMVDSGEWRAGTAAALQELAR